VVRTLTNTTAYDRLADALRAHGSAVRNGQNRAQAQCPAHEDRNPSLSLTKVEGSVLMHCHAGCATEDVLGALDLAPADLFDTRNGQDYHYRDVGGTVLRTVTRTPQKRFRQSGQTKGTSTLYRLPEVIAAVQADRHVWLVEGEKDVHALEALGEVATTAPMGSANFSKVDPTPLYGGSVVVVVDRDEAGQRWAADVHAALSGHAIVQWVQAATGKDAADHIAAGHGLDAFEPIDPPQDGEAEDDDPGAFALDVTAEAHRIRVREAARDLIRAEQVTAAPPPPPVKGREFLAQHEEEHHLVHGLIPSKGKFLLAAAAKAGKTTTVHHTVGCLLTGRPIFGTFPVETDRPLRVHLIDNEMGDSLLRTWLRRLNLTGEQLDRLTVHSLLGHASTFDPTTPESRALWAERLAGADVVIIDCLSPFMQAVGLDENHDAGRWLVGLDELMAAAKVDVYGVIHHTGHAGERARGDSKILGWPFQTWTLNREATDDDDAADDAPRFLKARGRCGSVASGQLQLGADGLRYVAGATRAKARAEAKDTERLKEVLAAAAEHTSPGETFGTGAVAEWVGADPRTVRRALYRGVSNGLLAKHDNPSGSGSVFSLVKGGGHGE